jgi:hypothetical protein
MDYHEMGPKRRTDLVDSYGLRHGALASPMIKLAWAEVIVPIHAGWFQNNLNLKPMFLKAPETCDTSALLDHLHIEVMRASNRPRPR